MEPWDFLLSHETLQPQGNVRMEGYDRSVSMACVSNDLSPLQRVRRYILILDVPHPVPLLSCPVTSSLTDLFGDGKGMGRNARCC